MLFYLFFSTLLLLSNGLAAELKYQQQVTLTSFKSKQDSKEIAHKFLQASLNDPDLRVIDITYQQEKWGADLIAYNSIITCFVSQVDKDILRIHKKAIPGSEHTSEEGFDLLQE